MKGLGLVAHVAKFGRAAVGHLAKHFGREKDGEGNYVKFGNQSIDPERTPENYNLAPDRDGISQADFIRQRCSEVRCLKRKDVNVMCSWIVTVPSGIVGTSYERKFFDETYKFLEGKYGRENVVSAYVHKDEVTPHMHFAFVPIGDDRKTGELKVSAKECLTRRSLQTFHGELSRHLEQALGLDDVGILNEATKEGNRSVEELKRGTAVKQLREIRHEISGAEKELSRLSKKILTSEEVREIGEKGKKTLFGGLKGVTFDEFEKLKNTAQFVDETEYRADRAETDAKNARNALAEGQKKIQMREAYLDEKQKFVEAEMEKTPSKQILQRNAELREENELVKTALRNVKKFVRDILPHIEKHLPEGMVAIARKITTSRSREREQGRDRGMDMGR